MPMQPIPFGKYVLVERLAQGGMAEVYRAVLQGAHGFEKQVALKRILPGFDGVSDFVTMFVDEARIASSLTHVNIAQVFDFGVEGGSYFLAMELVDGVDLGRLREAAARRGLRVPVPVAAFIVAEAARGLAYAHDKRGSDGAPLGIVHRDISPHNVLVSYAGEVKIVDFGIAKATGKLHKTESGAVMGKIRYMSPEQIAGEPLDGRSDLFALGVVLWELLAGAPLWPGDNPGAVADQIRNLKIEPPSRRAREVPAELDRIVAKALERRRDARYLRAAELARDLSTWLAAAAPSLTREDVGAFVAECVPRDAPAEAREATVDSRQSTAEAYAETKLAKPFAAGTPTVAEAPTAQRRRRRAPWIVAAIVILGAGGMLAARLVSLGTTLPSTPPPPLVVDAGVVAASSPDLGPRVSEADKVRMVAELEALPRADATVRGVPAEDYEAVLSAIDAALCATPPGAREPTIAADVRARLEAQQLVPEAQALWRYLAAVGTLPPRVTVALQAFLRTHAAWSPGAGGWTFARLGALVSPDDAALRLAVIRQNGARAAWRAEPRDGSALPFRELCERKPAVDAYAARAPGPRAALLERFLAATPADIPVDAEGIRYTLVEAERDQPAARLQVRLRVTNPGSDERPLALDQARLVGLATPPAVDPPATRLPANQVRELRLTFDGVTDDVAEAAVLVLRPGVELAAYSEDLQ